MQTSKDDSSCIGKFFRFKNIETEEAILKILNSHEGILEEEVAKYLNFTHARVKAGLFVDVKNIVRGFLDRTPRTSIFRCCWFI